jgi:hypothetical protein
MDRHQGKDSGATVVIRAYGVLAGILDDAVKARRLASSPARGVENLPGKPTKRHVYLSPEDVGRLAHESGQHRTLMLGWRTAGSGGVKRWPCGSATSSSYAGG